MPAETPEHLHDLFAQYFSAGKLDALMSLYEPEAVMIQQSGSPLVGLAAIRAHLANILALNGQMEIWALSLDLTGGLALLLSKWTLHGEAPGGAFERAGQTCDVARQQIDGSWQLIVDNPYGTAAA